MQQGRRQPCTSEGGALKWGQEVPEGEGMRGEGSGRGVRQKHTSQQSHHTDVVGEWCSTMRAPWTELSVGGEGHWAAATPVQRLQGIPACGARSPTSLNIVLHSRAHMFNCATQRMPQT